MALKQNVNANPDILAIGGGATAVGVASQIPATSGLISSLISSASSSAWGGCIKLGVALGKGLVGAVGAPVLIVGGLALIGYELYRQ